MALATDGSDYSDYAVGSATYIAQLRVWVKTLRKAVLRGNYSVEGRSWGPGAIAAQLASAEAELKSHDRVPFTRGKALLS